MTMTLSGSCHCQSVRFTVQSGSPFPFNRCYCDICRKTAGAGGFAINIGADYTTLQVEGQQHISRYNARMVDPDTGADSISSAERCFCSRCGSQLWLYDPRWPELVHPHASSIDTDLPVPPHRWHMMLDCRAPWAEPDTAPGDKRFPRYPDQSLADWHRENGD